MPAKPDNERSQPVFLAIEIGGTKLQLAAGTAHGAILQSLCFEVRQEAGADGIRSQIADALPALIKEWKPTAIGVGYGGPVDWREGRVVKSHQIAGWTGFPLASWLQDNAGVPVFVDNDANVAALGETLHGAGRGCSPVFYVTLGSGMGGGLVVEGNIFHGHLTTEMEIGHLRLESDGMIAESCCSGWSLDQRVREAASEFPETDLAIRVASDPGNDARHLGPAIKARDRVAFAILDEAARRIAQSLSHVTHLCGPQVIVLGGGVALLGEPLRSAVSRHLRGFLMESLGSGPRVALSSLRENAVPVGALAMAAQRFTSPAPNRNPMQNWLREYVAAQHRALDSVSLAQIDQLAQAIRAAWLRDAQIFAIGNGGSAANASHFATDLGKGSSDKLPRRVRVLSLTDNTAWITALGNDYSYDDAFVRQLQNYARSGDVLIAASVSGNSPNLLRAFEWANVEGLETVAIVGAKRGRLAEIARQSVVIEDTHYGRVEDVQMHILHMLCYAFMEVPEMAVDSQQSSVVSRQ